ncbi:septal ring lytic transglycosylase RlpA family protein [Microvirga sp. W0021]|uniref:Endolytic peptidoglycan transglycosylase RlpA n=1 Tax=Hohaiivirga grylli TaxID=3133970 RepID=A0ABV0BK48_9HYPH
MQLRYIAVAAFLLTCSTAQAETGKASWYGHESGTHTASGQRYNPHGKTVAHRSLPFGTVLRITDRHSGKAVTCQVTDRGPAKRTGRILDLSRGCASELGMIARGVSVVDYEVIN